MVSRYSFGGDPETVTALVRSFLDHGGTFHQITGFAAENPDPAWSEEIPKKGATFSLGRGMAELDEVLSTVIGSIRYEAPEALTGDAYGAWVSEAMTMAEERLRALNFRTDQVDLGPDFSVKYMISGMDLLGQIYVVVQDPIWADYEGIVLVYHDGKELQLKPR